MPAREDEPAAEPSDSDLATNPHVDPRGANRRRFLKIVTCGIGGAVGVAITIPTVRVLVHPVGRRIVVPSSAPIDIGSVGQVPTDGTPTKIAVVAPAVRDAWTAATNVPLGIAWLRREGNRVSAISGICPHLGCQVGWNASAGNFACPCHDSAFAPNGERLGGPAKRGLDPLPIAVENGRLRLTWIKYKPDIPERVPA